MKYKIFLMLTCIFISACNKRGKEDELSSFFRKQAFYADYQSICNYSRV